jgi:hypothetical protein
MEALVDWASPELMPTEVWTQRRKGELWMTILKRRRFLGEPEDSLATSYSSLACSRMLQIWLPTWRACWKPPYVRGGS